MTHAATPTSASPRGTTSPAQSPAPSDLYRSQSNDPVRRGVLRFLSCVRPSPPSRRYKFRHAVRLKSRSLLLKELERVQFLHAQPPEGYLLNPRPLDAQFVERLLILSRKLVFLDLPPILFQVAHHEVRQISRHRHFALDLRRLAQNLRHQQPALSIHLDHLPVVVGPLQKPFLRRIEGGEPRQLLLDPFPFLEGIHLCNLAIQTGDVKLQAVFLVDHALEFRRDLEPSFFVHASWVIAAKHLSVRGATGVLARLPA